MKTNILTKYLDTRNKKIAAGVAAAVIIAAIGGGTYFALRDEPEFKLKSGSVVTEYGEKVKYGFTDLVDTAGMDKEDAKELQDGTKITADIPNEVIEIKDEAGNVTGTEEKDYPAVGVYEIKIVHRGKKYSREAEVKDTTAPTVSLKDGAEYIQLNTGTDVSTFDFASFIAVEDLSQSTVTEIDASQVDANTVGNYPVAVTAEDIYGNSDTTNVYAIVADAGTDITALVEEVQEQKAADEKKKLEEKKESSTSSSKKDSTSSGSDKKDQGNSSGNNGNTGNSGGSSSGNNGGNSGNSGNSSTGGNSGNTGNTGGNSGNSGNNGGNSSAHTHDWKPVTTTVHHDEVGHYETRVVQEAYDEPVYEKHYVCKKCGYDSGKNEELMIDHIVYDCTGRYTYTNVQVGTKHHDAVTEKVWVVDKAAWDETITTGYKCSCGATK